MRELSKLRWITFLLCLLPFAGCTSDGGDGSNQDFEIMALDIATVAPQVGHELAVWVDLLAAEADTHVGLIFFLASRADVDADVPEPALTVVDARPLQVVEAGRNRYDMRIDVPETIAAGDYYLFVAVDPVEAVPESDEEDNGPTDEEIRELGIPITLGDTVQVLPDLVIDSIVADDPVVEVDVTPETHPPAHGHGESENNHLGVTAIVRASGNTPVSGIVIRVRIEVVGLGVFPLQVWNPVTDAFEDVFTLDTLVPTEPTAVHLDCLIPDSARDIFADLLPAELSGIEADTPIMTLATRLHVDIDPFDEILEHETGISVIGDEDNNDNREIVPIILQVFEDGDGGGGAPQVAGSAEPPANAINWEVPYIKDFTNGNVGVGVHFHANADVDTKGVLGEATASVPAMFAGNTVDLLNLSAKGRYDPLDDTQTGFVVTLKALNQKLYEKRTVKDETLDQASPLSYSKEVSFSTTFFAGPVPMNVKVGARGEVGLDVNATAGTTFEVYAEPYVRFNAFIEGGIGGSIAVCSLTAGVGAQIPLIEDRFHAGVTAGLDYTNGILTGSITEMVSNTLNGPAGRVYLFVDGSCGWGWASYSKRWEYTLVTWKAFDRTDTLFNKTQSVSVEIE
jgi:hypothetical protein